MKTSIVALLLALIASSASAGPNAGGLLYLALAGDVVYTEGTDYCGTATTNDCRNAVTRADGTSASQPAVIHCLAQFFGNTRLAGVSFGIDYDDAAVRIVDFRSCGDAETPQGDWPAPGTGTVVHWDVEQGGASVEVYWFAAFAYADGYSMDLIPHPTEDGYFMTGDDPPIFDPIAYYGRFGFGLDIPHCIYEGEPEACCLPGGLCQFLIAEDCIAQGGEPQGPGSVCTPMTCVAETGACCTAGGCVVTTATDCDGEYQGDGTDCDPDPCVPVPSIETTWGGVKRTYR
ncbi:MAG: hypothetical protein R3E12_14260 [Candidatus Eisenbacteria bacterium]|uniref:Uncharacterized protein n=1 Tax=Eiseniibacteriota bacterium TaxID=2212470 RepID=A0A956LYP4_UNCEI|nr:hypothetical protein [Candidatus Eisenbacteria bacterium]